LVTAPEIIFFWVARMIMAGYEFMGQKPFSEVYFTGIVRDKQGKKMSKQFGNSPDLLALIDVHEADAVRFSVIISSPAGNDLLYDEAALEQGRNFCNKMWNALKLIKGWENRIADNVEEGDIHFAIDWMEQRLAEASQQIAGQIKEFRLSEGLKTIYSLIWDDFCSWYLEWVKPAMDQSMPHHVYQRTIDIYEQLLQLLHPYMPFVTEEIYHELRERKPGHDLMVQQLPVYESVRSEILKQGEMLQEVITAVRDARVKNGLKPKDSIRLWITTQHNSFYDTVQDILRRQVNAEFIGFTDVPKEETISVVVQTDKLYIEAEREIDTAAQKEQLQKELEYLKGFLESVNKKLGNERFVQNAKAEIVDNERRKKEDAEAKIKTLEESLGLL
ncbi:MAG: class I tRNA ligase family protein, partial [Taibaiella sp.]|nr:class I tRNA ligase family protein [Taibaiella sp.]